MSEYSERDRDYDRMRWVKTQPCMWRDLSRCAGVVEADHGGRRPLSHKAPDDTCVPCCTLHHRQRTDCSGPFRYLTRDEMRMLLDAEIERMQKGYERHRTTSADWW